MKDNDDTCPICSKEIETIEQVDEVTYRLVPCGHQMDEHVYADLFED